MDRQTKIDDSKREIWARDQGVCRVCGRPGREIAHKIPQRFIDTYGEEVIHHPWNMVLVCSKACNDSVSISNHPVEIERLVSEIHSELSWDEMHRYD